MADVGIEELPGGSPGPATVPLTHRTARGFAWMISQTLITKVTGIIGQVMLAWFLSPADFGIVSVAYAVASFPSAIRDAGLQNILVQRQHFLKRWVNPVFGMSLALGILSALIFFAISPIVAARYHDPRLIGLLVTLGIGSIVNALGTVPNALAQVQLRFRLQAVLSLVCALVMTAMSVLMAWRGYGAYSFVVPTVASNLIRHTTLWIAVRYPVRLRLGMERWRMLLHDSGMMVLTQLLYVSVANGDYLILGARYRDNKDVVGQFYFAFNLSLQTLAVLSVNLMGVLFPTLVRLAHDPLRQARAFVRSMRLMALITIPACLLQAALAGPGIHLLFNAKWAPSIPILQALNVAMAIHTVGLMYLTLLTAQGRFRLQVLISSISSVFFLTFVAVAAYRGQGFAVAVAEAIFFTLNDGLWLYVVLKRDLPDAWSQVLQVFMPPLLASLIAIGPALLLTMDFPTSKIGNAMKIVAVGIIAIAAYIPLIRYFAPEAWKELLALRRGGEKL